MNSTAKWAVYWAAMAVATQAPHHARAQDPGAAPPSAAGDWHGTLTAPTGAKLRIGVTLTAAKTGGAYDGVLTSVDQGGTQIPLDTAKVDKGVLSFSIAAIMGNYVGRWDATQKAWVGEWLQGAAMPLVLTAGKP